jgi:predicted kinase
MAPRVGTRYGRSGDGLRRWLHLDVRGHRGPGGLAPKWPAVGLSILFVMEAQAAPRLVLICGLPGSGKTTVAKRLAREFPALRLPGDEWMAHLAIDLWDEDARDRLEKLFWQLTQELLQLGQSVILESGFWLRSDRDEKRLGARALGVPVELRYLATPTEELVRRVEARSAQNLWGTVPIARQHLEGWLPFFQAPDDEELALFDPPVSPDADSN